MDFGTPAHDEGGREYQSKNGGADAPQGALDTRRMVDFFQSPRRRDHQKCRGKENAEGGDEGAEEAVDFVADERGADQDRPRRDLAQSDCAGKFALGYPLQTVDNDFLNQGNEDKPTAEKYKAHAREGDEKFGGRVPLEPRHGEQEECHESE